MFGQLDFSLGLGDKIFENCIYKNCFATHNKEYLPVEKFDAILFHGIEYQRELHGQPQKRNLEQVYIFSNQESPIHTPYFIKDYNNFYNWTMTYRLDSDIIRPYGFFEKRHTHYQPPTALEIQNRTKKIAWFVSNCNTHSSRERIVRTLNKYIPVEIYGSCGNYTCPRNMTQKCYQMLEKEYKFYLSFENSLCEDYITEKLYNVLKLNIVPIVYGGANYKKLAPPHSLINIHDFKSIKSLAKYIKYLSSNTHEYLKYFEWKKKYVVDTSNRLALCTLCKKLNQPKKTKFYSNLVEWWQGPNFEKCTDNKKFA